MNLPLLIGLRYTGAPKKNRLLSFFSGVSISGLVVGVGMLVAVLSIMNGFDRELRERILGLVPQAAIYQRGGVDNWSQLQKRLEKHPKILAAAPFVQLEGLVSHKGNAEPVALFGIDPDQENRVSRLNEFIGPQLQAQLNGAQLNLVLGKVIANKLSLVEGDKVLIVVPSEKSGRAPKIEYFSLIKVLATETELDNTLAITSLYGAAKLSGEPNKVTGMRLKVEDLFQAKDIVWETVLEFGLKYYGSSWLNTHGNLYQAIHMSKKLIALLMSLIVAIAAFNVVSTLVMVVVEKQGDIAILRTFGATTRQIMGVFIVQGTLIGIIGSALGLLFGVALAKVIQFLVGVFEGLTGAQVLKSDVYPLTYLPTEIALQDLVQVGLTALIMSFIATLYPAWRASRTKPAEILRYE